MMLIPLLHSTPSNVSNTVSFILIPLVVELLVYDTFSSLTVLHRRPVEFVDYNPSSRIK